MNLKLTRNDFNQSGIFGRLETEDGKLVAYTLEHAFGAHAPDTTTIEYRPKLPVGTYRCIRGTHRLHDLKPFETFEVQKVPNATGILFHVGNYNADSEGCILLGDTTSPTGLGFSRKAFENFMDLQAHYNEFFLEVV